MKMSRFTQKKAISKTIIVDAFSAQKSHGNTLFYQNCHVLRKKKPWKNSNSLKLTRFTQKKP